MDLTARELDVLAVSMKHRGLVVDTHVKWIRRKLGSAATYLETLRGVGYRFTDRSDGP